MQSWSSDDSDARAFRHWSGYVVQSLVPALTLARALTALWAACFVVFFLNCRALDDTGSLLLQRRVTASWLAPLYTGHVAVDAGLCIAGICLGKKVLMQKGGVSLTGPLALARFAKDRLIRVYPPYLLLSCLTAAWRHLVSPAAPLTTCTLSDWVAELTLRQTSLPFSQQCCPWLWPVAIACKATALVALLAGAAGVVVTRARALTRHNPRFAVVMRWLGPTPSWLVLALCAFAASSCIAFRWDYYPLLFNHTISVYPKSLFMPFWQYYFATSRSRIGPFFVGVLFSQQATQPTPLTALMRPLCAASTLLVLGLVLLDVSEITAWTTKKDDAFVSAVLPCVFAASLCFTIRGLSSTSLTQGWVQRVAASPPFFLLATVSYSLALVFPPVACAGFVFLPPATTPFQLLSLCAILVPVGIAVAILFHLCVEALTVRLLRDTYIPRLVWAKALLDRSDPGVLAVRLFTLGASTLYVVQRRPPAYTSAAPGLQEVREAGATASPLFGPGERHTASSEPSTDASDMTAGAVVLAEDAKRDEGSSGEDESEEGSEGALSSSDEASSSQSESNSEDEGSGEESPGPGVDLEALATVADGILAECNGVVERDAVNRAVQYAEMTGLSNPGLVRLIDLLVDRSITAATQAV